MRIDACSIDFLWNCAYNQIKGYRRGGCSHNRITLYYENTNDFMKKSIIFVFLLTLVFVVSPKLNANASNSNLQKTYIGETAKEILDIFDDKNYYSEAGNRFYYYEKTFILRENVSISNLGNDMDSFVYVVKTLEYYASLYDNNANVSAINNLVLGYLRTRKIDGNGDAVYGSGHLWTAIAGGIDQGFVNYINNNQTLGWLRNYLSVTNELLIIDPLNPTYCALNLIDIIHMIAVIDGTYSHTGQFNDAGVLGNLVANFQRDLSGWAGDLQQFVRRDLHLRNINPATLVYCSIPENSNYPVDFGTNLGLGTSNFSNSDMLADIDGMSIAKYFLDVENLLSVALSGYYNFVYYDNTQLYNRYSVFILSVTEETRYRSNSVTDDFKNEIYYSMGIENDDWYGLQNLLFLSDLNPEFYILSGRYANDGGAVGLPSFNYRKYGANLFINYIIGMASAPKTSPGSGGGSVKPPITKLPNQNDFPPSPPFGGV